MNASLTFNSVVFEPALPNSDGSLRQSSSRGYALQDTLSIRAQSYVDSETKVSGVKRTATVSGYYKDTSGVRHRISFAVSAQIPDTATSTDVSTVLATFKAAIADANFMADVLNNES